MISKEELLIRIVELVIRMPVSLNSSSTCHVAANMIAAPMIE